MFALGGLFGSSTVEAGAVPIPKHDAATLDPFSYVSYDVYFYGNELAQVRVHSYGSTFLQVIVFDDRGNIVAQDNDKFGDALPSWIPPRMGCYTIKVINNAPLTNSFYISTN
jgi:hypothetical protein